MVKSLLPITLVVVRLLKFSALGLARSILTVFKCMRSMNDLDHDTPPGGIQERAAPLDLSGLDRTRLGPNGEKPWIPEDDPPAPTIEWLDYQYKLAAKNRAIIDINGDYNDASEVIGEYRELTPCPRTGKISFKQIGDLRLKKKDIALDDEDLLICRRPVASGQLDGYNNPIFRHEEPTNDPKDFYRALWGHGYDIYRAKVLPMNPLNAWNEGFSNPYPLDNDQEDYGYGRRGVQVLENDGGKYFRIYNSSYSEDVFVGVYPDGRPAFERRYYVRATFATCYIGRIPPGTRLEWCVDIYKENGDWRSEDGSFQIRGWAEGYFGGDFMDYENISFRSAGNDKTWRCYSGELTVDERFNDLWLSFQQNGSDNTTQYQNIYFRNFQIWRA